MAFHGTLTRWSDERGFGFITPAAGGQEVFVHVSAFARGQPRPAAGAPVEFEVDTAADGRKRAVRVRLGGAQERRGPPPPPAPAQRAERARPRQRPRPQGRNRALGLLAALVLAAALGPRLWSAVAHRAAPPRPAAAPAQPAATAAAVPPAAAAALRCDGRQYCSQMTSCAEAKFFLQHCPDPRMDGDGNGVPCEQQWCTSPLAP